MAKYYYTRIEDRDEFTRICYRYKKIQTDDERHIYVYRMTDEDGSIVGYEVVKGIKQKQPDGTPVWVYPNDEQFGTYGWYICGRPERCRERIAYRVRQLEERYDTGRKEHTQGGHLQNGGQR